MKYLRTHLSNFNKLVCFDIKKPISISCLMFSVLTFGGCYSLDAVGKISNNLTSASKTWGTVSEEVLASCNREKYFNSKLLECDDEKRATDGLLAANAVLASYFDAISAAANEKNFAISSGLNTASASVSEIPGVNETQVQSVSGLFSTLSNLATSALREETLRELINDGGEPAKVLITGLDDLISESLKNRLAAEQIQLTSTFSGWLLAETVSIPSPPTKLCSPDNSIQINGSTGGGAFLLIQDFCRRQNFIDSRIKAVTDYQKSLMTATKAISELQSSGGKLKSEELAKKLDEISGELTKNIDSLEEAFE